MQEIQRVNFHQLVKFWAEQIYFFDDINRTTLHNLKESRDNEFVKITTGDA
jgi:hypothetical protein